MLKSLNLKDEKYIKYFGRVLKKDTIDFYNTCSGFKFSFTGKKVILKFENEQKVNIKVTVDNEFSKYYITSKELVVFDGIYGNHIVEIIRVNSHATGGTLSLSNVLTDGSYNEIKTENKLKLEFYGDSLTCGYEVYDDGTGDSITNEDGTLAYAYLIKEELDAECSIISRSGMSLVLPYWVDTPYINRYNYYTPTVGDDLWDYSKYIPDYVFINHGTNDQAALDNSKGSIEEFKKGYKDFLGFLREKYANVKIICSYGMACKKDYIDTAIKELIEEINDKNIYYVSLNPVEYSERTGHPTRNGYVDCKNQIMEFFNKIK